MQSQYNIVYSIKKLATSRIDMVFVYTWTAAIGSIIGGNGLPPILPTLYAIGAGFFLTYAVYLYNDVIDREMDLASPNVSKKERPLASGLVPVSHAMRLIYICAATGLALCFLINITSFLFGLIFFSLFSLYSYPAVRLKSKYIVKSLVTSTGPSWTMLIGGYAASGMLAPQLMFAAILQAAFMFFMLPALADSFDLEEDKAFGMKTMAMTLSWTQKVHFMFVAVALVFVASISGYVYFGFNFVLPIIVTLFSIFLIKEITSLYKGYDEIYTRRVRKFAYTYFTFLPVFMAIGNLNIAMLL